MAAVQECRVRLPIFQEKPEIHSLWKTFWLINGQLVQLFKICGFPESRPIKSVSEMEGNLRRVQTSFYSWIPFQSESQSGQMIFQGESDKFSSRTRTEHLSSVSCIPFLPWMRLVASGKVSRLKSGLQSTQNIIHLPFHLFSLASGQWIGRILSLLYEARSRMLLFPVDFPLT